MLASPVRADNVLLVDVDPARLSRSPARWSDVSSKVPCVF